MQIKTLIYFLLISSSIFGQEIGQAKSGNHSIKLLKSNNLFKFVYSDINSKAYNDEKSFNFPNKETLYSIIMNGFNNHNSHQVFVLTDKDTVVKFEYNKVRGVVWLKINHNNLKNKMIGISAYFNKEQIIKLFGEKA